MNGLSTLNRFLGRRKDGELIGISKKNIWKVYGLEICKFWIEIYYFSIFLQQFFLIKKNTAGIEPLQFHKSNYTLGLVIGQAKKRV